MVKAAGLALAVALLLARPALAHSGEPLSPHDIWNAWEWNPFILGGIGLAGWLYIRGARELWQRAGMGRGISTWQVLAFLGGLASLFVALISPVDALGTVLFAGHMVQHLLLIFLAPLLLLMGLPSTGMWMLPRRWRPEVGRWWNRQRGLHRLWGWVSHPVSAWVLHALAMWAWHLPDLYQAALENERLHVVEHASFFGTALLFWWALLRLASARVSTASRGAGLASALAGVVYVFTMALASGFLGALITFSPEPWYSFYASTTNAWGLTPLEDQQLAGVIMWIPAGVVYVGTALALVGRLLFRMEQADRPSEFQVWAAPPLHEANPAKGRE